MITASPTDSELADSPYTFYLVTKFAEADYSSHAGISTEFTVTVENCDCSLYEWVPPDDWQAETYVIGVDTNKEITIPMATLDTSTSGCADSSCDQTYTYSVTYQ